MRKMLALTVLVVCGVASDTNAQTVQRPSRPYRGLFGGGPTPDPNRSRQELTLSGNLSVGYDTWLVSRWVRRCCRSDEPAARRSWL